MSCATAQKVGRVIRVDHFPAQDLLIVRPSAGSAQAEREIMVPFVAAIVPEVDVAAGRVTVTPPPGLFEELPPSDDDETPDAVRQGEGPDRAEHEEPDAADGGTAPTEDDSRA